MKAASHLSTEDKWLIDSSIGPLPSSESDHAFKLLLFAYYFPPENESGAARPARFRKYLAREGCLSHVISRRCTKKGDEARHEPQAQPPAPGALPVTLSRFVQRVVLPYNDALPWVPHAISAARSVVERQNIRVVLSTSPPVSTHIAAMLLKRRAGLPWVADFRDPLYGNLTRTGLRALFCDSVLERAIFNEADALIANTDEVAETWRKRYPAHAHKISVIYNGFDPDEPVSPLPAGENGKRIITHAGAIYGGRDPGLLLASTRRLIEQNRLSASSFLICLIGQFERESLASAELFDWHQARGCLELSSGALPKAEADDAVARSEYLLLLDNNRHGASPQVPAKLFHYIRLGRFILALTPKRSPTSRILAQSGIPFACLSNDTSAEEVDREVLSMLRQRLEPLRPSHWFEANFNAVSQTASLLSILKRVAFSKTRA
jgi:hypothetical protein